MVYYTLTIIHQRLKTFVKLQRETDITEPMPESLITLDVCLTSLAKSEKLIKLEDLAKFLQSCYTIDKYANKIF